MFLQWSKFCPTYRETPEPPQGRKFLIFLESAKVSHKRVFALLTPEKPQLEMAEMLQKPVFALPGCQLISVNTLLCDALGLADKF